MADRNDLEFTYSLIDRIFRLSLGEMADFSGAKYDGDFSLTLEQAQRRKHDYVAEQMSRGGATEFKRNVIRDLESRRDAYCVDEPPSADSKSSAGIGSLKRNP